MSQIEEQVKTIIVGKLGIEPSQVTIDANFANDLGADSLDIVELVMEFEHQFKITIPDNEAEKIKTVGEVVKYIQEHTSK
ncbi:MAG: acyl carrier protein [Chitinophagaceae bacterium]|nr:acyl carrier protein [Chitinophagaceae bacterium]